MGNVIEYDKDRTEGNREMEYEISRLDYFLNNQI